MASPLAPARALDPFAPAPGSAYRDDRVEVRALGLRRPRRTLGMVRTEHFDVTRTGSRVRVEHRIAAEEVHDGLAGVLADELFRPGWLAGSDLFERLFTGVVLSSAPDAMTGWERFYRNTMDRLTDPGRAAGSRPGCNLGEYAPVHRHAESLLAPGPVLELGSCFGFFALRAAAGGRRTTATDLSANTMRLLAAVAPRLGVGLDTLPADAADVPLPDGSAATVVALHLLEHLSPEHGDRVLDEALRLATRRVVVAVPLETTPDATWGHVRAITLDDLRAWGERSGCAFEVHEHHGGWLVLHLP